MSGPGAKSVMTPAVVARTTGASLETVHTLMGRGALPEMQDAVALQSLIRQEYTEEEILAWSVHGLIRDVAAALDNGISIDVVAQMPRTGTDGRHLHRNAMAIRRADSFGMAREDVPLWCRGGVTSPVAPFLNTAEWDRWRSVGATAIGMRMAALACAAGLTPEEAREQIGSGKVDRAALELLAGLNG